MVICELLGVPYAGRDRFQQDAAIKVDLANTAEERAGAVHRAPARFAGPTIHGVDRLPVTW